MRKKYLDLDVFKLDVIARELKALEKEVSRCRAGVAGIDTKSIGNYADRERIANALLPLTEVLTTCRCVCVCAGVRDVECVCVYILTIARRLQFRLAKFSTLISLDFIDRLGLVRFRLQLKCLFFLRIPCCKSQMIPMSFVSRDTRIRTLSLTTSRTRTHTYCRAHMRDVINQCLTETQKLHIGMFVRWLACLSIM